MIQIADSSIDHGCNGGGDQGAPGGTDNTRGRELGTADGWRESGPREMSTGLTTRT